MEFKKPLHHKVLKKSPSVKQLKEEMRKEFKKRIGTQRNAVLSNRRNLFSNIVSNVQTYFSNVEPNLLEGTTDIDTEKMLRILIEVEKELNEHMSQTEAEQYALNLQNETEAIVENFYICNLCNKPVHFQNNPFVICDNCSKLYFSTDDFE